MRSRFLRHVEAEGDLQAVALLTVLLSCSRTRTPEVRTDWLEQSVRIQRDRFAY